MIPRSLLLRVVASALPTPPTPPTPPAPPVAGTTTHSQWLFKCGASEIEIQTTGNVTLDPESDPMFDLHGDGTLRVRERARRHLRLLIAHAADVSWTVDGKVGPFEADGKAWLRRILKARPAVPVPPKPPEL